MGFGKDGTGVILREARGQAIGALASEAAIILGTNTAILERFRIIKLEVYAVINAMTTGEGTGLLFGIADGDFSISEIEAAIEVTGPLGPNDNVLEEVAERYVKILGAVDRETGTEAIFENEKGGHKMERNIRWTFARTKSWNFFIYNLGAAFTTGATCNLRATSYGVWVT